MSSWQIFLLEWKQKWCPLSSFVVNIVQDVPDCLMGRQKKIQVEKKEVKLSWLTCDNISYVENPKESKKKKKRLPD